MYNFVGVLGACANAREDEERCKIQETQGEVNHPQDTVSYPLAKRGVNYLSDASTPPSRHAVCDAASKRAPWTLKTHSNKCRRKKRRLRGRMLLRRRGNGFGFAASLLARRPGLRNRANEVQRQLAIAAAVEPLERLVAHRARIGTGGRKQES